MGVVVVVVVVVVVLGGGEGVGQGSGGICAREGKVLVQSSFVVGK